MEGLKNLMYFILIPTAYIFKEHCDVLDKPGLVGDNFSQSENVYKDSGVFYRLFSAAKISYCLRIDDSGIIEEHKFLGV